MSLFKLILILIAIILIFVLWKWLKPYFVKHDTTILFTGGLGAGKTLEAVKTSIVLIRKQRFYKYTMYNLLHVKLINYFIRKTNYFRSNKIGKKELKQLNKNSYKFYNEYLQKHEEWNKGKKPYKKQKLNRPKPMLYSNMPIHFKTHGYSSKREWAEILTPHHVCLTKKITEYSVVLIDEFPQFINQFNWKEEIVQNNVNEFITFFRHYIGGFFIATAQSESDIVVQIRRKLNQAIWCFDFKKHLFGLFYTNRMCDIMLSENISTMSTTFIEDNTKLHFGMFPAKKTYDTRCYSIRYNNIYERANPRTYFDNIKTYNILRLNPYDSPLDLKTTLNERKTIYDFIQQYSTIKKM